jgi:hypothetical protein
VAKQKKKITAQLIINVTFNAAGAKELDIKNELLRAAELLASRGELVGSLQDFGTDVESWDARAEIKSYKS